MPPAATAAEPPAQPAGGGLFKGKVDPYSLTPTHGITLGRNRYNALKQDIAEHGMKDTIKFVEHNGQRYVVNGHHRLRIAKELKMPEYDHWATKERFPTNVEAAYKVVKGG